MIDKLCYAAATGFGVGNSKYMPGTVGTLVFGLPLGWLLNLLSFPTAFTLLILLTLVSIVICTRAEIFSKKHDPSNIILDEAIGFGFAAILLPPDIMYWGLAFVLFRFFDIVKPMLINHLQSLPRGYGVVLDDVLAGIYSAFIIFLVQLFIG